MWEENCYRHQYNAELQKKILLGITIISYCGYFNIHPLMGGSASHHLIRSGGVGDHTAGSAGDKVLLKLKRR